MAEITLEREFAVTPERLFEALSTRAELVRWWGHDGWTKFLPKKFKSPSTNPYHHAKEDIITPIMGEAMAKFLTTIPDDKPFCLSVSFNTPHGSQTTSMHTEYADWRKMTRPANENPALKGTRFYDSLYHQSLHVWEQVTPLQYPPYVTLVVLFDLYYYHPPQPLQNVVVTKVSMVSEYLYQSKHSQLKQPPLELKFQ